MKPKAHADTHLSTLPMPDRDHIQGPIGAPIKLLEYGDYEWPFCGQAYPAVRAIQKRLGNRLCFTFRNSPLSNSHPHAQNAAEAAEAAGDQGHFWQMHDLLYENQNELEDEDLAGYAASLHLDEKRRIREVLSGAHAARIRKDFRSGARNGVNGTPPFFINGVPYDGRVGVDEFLAAITEPV